MHVHVHTGVHVIIIRTFTVDSSGINLPIYRWAELRDARRERSELQEAFVHVCFMCTACTYACVHMCG